MNDLKKTRKIARYLYERNPLLINRILRGFGNHTKQQPIIFQYRKCVIAIKHHGCEHRVNRLLKVLIYLSHLFNGQRVVIGNAEIVFLKEWLKLLDVILILVMHKSMNLVHHVLTKRVFPQTTIVIPLFSVINVIVQTTYPDGTEFIQVGSGNGQKLKAIKNTSIDMLRLIQDTVVELQPTEVATDVVTIQNLFIDQVLWLVCHLLLNIGVLSDHISIRAYLAFFSINSLRGATSSPISIENR